jgi:hypothetical protein
VRARSVWLAALLACAHSAGAEWQVASTRSEAAVRAGVEHRRIVLQDEASGGRATVELAVFSQKSATLRVIDDPDANESLGEVMQREGCIAGTNGGYFDPDYAPVGLLVSDGRIIAPLRKAKLLSGVVSVVNGRIQIQRSGTFSLKSKPSAARQCGPFLVERGRAVVGLNDTRSARRTFVATLAGDRAALGYCSPVTLAQLGRLLGVPQIKMQSALNLDGGSSSGFWFAAENGVFSIREQKTVRDYLGIAAK